MARATGLLALYSILCAFVSSAQAGEIVSYAHLRSGTLKIIFRFEEGKEQWVAPLVAEAAGYLPLVERYVGIRFPYRDYIIIEGCHDCISNRNGRTILMSYEAEPSTNPALLFHELNHFWFYYWGDLATNAWVIEGIASFLPVALRQARLLPDEDRYNRQIDSWWGIETIAGETSNDRPLYPFREALRGILYQKSYRLQFLINRLLGPRNYRKFVKQIALGKKRQISSTLPLLKVLKRYDWEKLLAGWVTGSRYRRVPLEAFWKDPDLDGLSSAREFCFSTDPNKPDTDGDRIPDGAEASLGTNPRRVDQNAVELIATHGPFIDGDLSDWAYQNAVNLTERGGDSDGIEWADILEMSYIIKNNTLYMMIRTSTTPVAEADVFFDLLVDADSDGNQEEEFAFMLKTPKAPWHYNPGRSESDTPEGIRAAIGHGIEVSVSLDLIPFFGFSVLPIIRNDATKQNYDQWDRWEQVRSSSFPLKFGATPATPVQLPDRP